MRIFSRLMATFAILITAFTAPAIAQDTASARMKRVMPYMDKFVAMPEADRDLIRLVYRIKSRSQAGENIRAWYDLNGVKNPLTLNHRGEMMELPPITAWKANPKVYTNVPRKDVVLAMRVRPNVPHATAIDADLLTASIAQADKGIRKFSGVFGLFQPKLKGYQFEVRTGATAEIVYKDGTSEPLYVKEIDPLVSHIQVDRQKIARAETLKFSIPPEVIKYLD